MGYSHHKYNTAMVFDDVSNPLSVATPGKTFDFFYFGKLEVATRF